MAQSTRQNCNVTIAIPGVDMPGIKTFLFNKFVNVFAFIISMQDNSYRYIYIISYIYFCLFLHKNSYANITVTNLLS